MNLTVNPVDGGSSMRFGRVDTSASSAKELRMRVASNDGRQYQIYQRITEPLVNEQGSELNRDGLLAYSLVGSNSQGSLYQQSLEPVASSDQLLYSSNTAGDSDMFTMIYKVDAAQIKSGGQYIGKLLFTVRPIGGNAEQTVSLPVQIEAGGETKVNGTTSSGLTTVRLNSEGKQNSKEFVQLSVKNYFGAPFKIMQEITEWPHNEEGVLLNQDAVLFYAESAGGQISVSAPAALPRRETEIFTSSDPAHDVGIAFTLNPEQAERETAGTYRGKIQYRIAGDAALAQTFDFDLEIDIAPVFELTVTFPEGGIHFSSLLPGAPPQHKEVDVIVRTNLGRPFTVSQNIQDLLTNEQGERIESEAFGIKEEFLTENRGTLKFPDFTPVAAGETPIYHSDAAGSPAHFKVIYRLKPVAGMTPGDYATIIVYSLGET